MLAAINRKTPVGDQYFSYIFRLVGSKYEGHKKSASWVSPKWVKSNEQRKKERKGRRGESVLSMAR